MLLLITDKILPRGAPSVARRDKRMLTLNELKIFDFFRNVFNKSRRLLDPYCERMPYFQMVSYAFSRSKKIATACCLIIKAFLINDLRRISERKNLCGALKTALNMSQKVVRLKIINERIVDYPFHGFTYTAG